MMDIYDAFAQNTSAVSQISRADNGRLERIEFNSKSETVDFEGETYEASEVIDQLRNSDQFEETSFQKFQRNSTVDSDGPSSGLITAGYVLAALFPIIGIIMAIVIFAKGSGKHGGGVLAASLFAWFLWAAILL